MTTKVQILRNIGNTPVAKPTLLAGEFAYAKPGFVGGGANELIIGDGTATHVLVSALRQLELIGNQTVTSGTKTFAAGAKIALAVADLKVSGGTAGQILTTDGAGNLTWGTPSATGPAPDGTTIVDNGDGTMSVAVGGIADGVTVVEDANGKLAVNKAVTADVNAGTADKFVDTALLKTDVLGAALTALTTNAKTVVPAINELYNTMTAMSGGIIFAGTLDASTGDITAASGVANVPANISAVVPADCKNYFWIVTKDGSNVGTGNTVPAIRQDWVACDGTKLVTLNYAMQNVAAVNVSYDEGTNVNVVGTNVQEALDSIETALLGPIDAGTF